MRRPSRTETLGKPFTAFYPAFPRYSFIAILRRNNHTSMLLSVVGVVSDVTLEHPVILIYRRGRRFSQKHSSIHHENNASSSSIRRLAGVAADTSQPLTTRHVTKKKCDEVVVSNVSARMRIQEAPEDFVLFSVFSIDICPATTHSQDASFLGRMQRCPFSPSTWLAKARCTPT